MSRYLKEVHRCVMPRIKPDQNLGTVWECDCKSRWVVSLSHYDGQHQWSRLEHWKFNEAEDRLLTQEEIMEYLSNLAKSSPSPYRVVEEKKFPFWRKVTWRFRRNKW